MNLWYDYLTSVYVDARQMFGNELYKIWAWLLLLCNDLHKYSVYITMINGFKIIQLLFITMENENILK